jgi:tripartite-type tricarboxylate transporter receptor subunit TctC
MVEAALPGGILRAGVRRHRVRAVDPAEGGTVNLKTLLSLALVAVALAAAPATAQYPTRAVKLIVPFAPGGATDTAARIVAQSLGKSLGQAVVVENKPGADGAIAAQAAATAPADGYTLFFATSSMFALPYVMKPAPFDMAADFVPVSSVAKFDFCLFVNPGVPARTPQELIAHVRANPGKLNYATNNLGEHLVATQFMKAAGGLDMVRIPYKGMSQALPDLITGNVHVLFGPMSAGLPFAKDGRIRVLATMLQDRSSHMPDIPTLEETGVIGVRLLSSQMILAPAKTPREVVERLNREVRLVLRDPDVRAEFAKQAILVEETTPQELRALFESIDRTWAQYGRENKLAQQ